MTSLIAVQMISFLLFLLTDGVAAFVGSPVRCGRKTLSWGLFAKETDDFKSIYPNANIMDISLSEHKPLGCTVEESLGDTTLKPVFVSKVEEGGFADMAGIEVGDVILGVSGMFGGLKNVVGMGIEEVTSTVAARDEGEVLEFQVARGTEIMSVHESALVDLCASIGADEQEIEDCVVDFLASAYEDDQVSQDDECEDEDGDCLLDETFESLWGEELRVTPIPEPDEEEQEEKPKPKPKKLPWRSRSSPSGTYVRDPRTGKMRNIDA